MPGWHAKSKELVANGKLKVVGITEEQHPDRTVLFMQWQEMKWPVMLDSLNVLGVKGIPYTFLIDEHGIIRYKNPNGDELNTFVSTHYADDKELSRQELAIERGSAEHLLQWKGDAAVSSAISLLEERLSNDSNDAKAHFRLGVAYRKRYDSDRRQADDFSKAIEQWSAALALDPNQYIWRRRIQQYGPRLDKPYSFYDWVNTARTSIKERGDTPTTLVAEPGGSEFAYPEKQAGANKNATPHPDPEGKIHRDTNKLVHIESTVVPSTKGNAPSARVHLRFRPDALRKVHWTNEAGPLAWFADPKADAKVVFSEGPAAIPTEGTSTEMRSVEFDVRPAEDGRLPKVFKSAAFYYVCEDIGGQCLYLRQDIEVSLDQ